LGAFSRARQIEFSGRGIERGEQFVFCQDAIAFPLSAEGIQQTGFSGVGVTNQRNPWQATTLIAKTAAMGLQLLLIPQKSFNSSTDRTTVFFQLGFARTSGSNAAPLPGHALAAA
jgi:hypothetical protein